MTLKQKNSQAELTARYLLGELSESERSRLEARFFSDDDRFAELLSVEDELIAAYLANDLTDDKREKFERQFLRSPRRVKRIELARALGRTKTTPNPEAAPQSTPEVRIGFFNRVFAARPELRWVFGTVGLVLLTGTVWLALQKIGASRGILTPGIELAGVTRSNRQVDRPVVETPEQADQTPEPLQTEKSRRAGTDDGIPEARPDENRSPQQNTRTKRESDIRRDSERSGRSIVTFLLTSSLTRDLDESASLRLTKETRTVILRLVLPKNAYETYEVSLQTPDGSEVWRGEKLKASRSKTRFAVSVPVPAGNLKPGEYILHLDGRSATGQVETINQYVFSVASK